MRGLIVSSLLVLSACQALLVLERDEVGEARDSGAVDVADVSVTDGANVDAPLDASEERTSSPRCNPDAPFDDPVPMVELNTADDETSARAVDDDENVIYFDSGGVLKVARRSATDGAYVISTVNAWSGGPPKPHGRAMFHAGALHFDAAGDLWRATFDASSQAFDVPTPLSALSAGIIDADIWLAASGRVYFSRFEGADFVLYVADAPTATPALLEISGTNAVAPVLSSDELAMYYTNGDVSDRFVNRATRASKTGKFGPPVPLAPLNVAGREQYPRWISTDECVIYFARRMPGNPVPPGDLYRAVRGQ